MGTGDAVGMLHVCVVVCCTWCGVTACAKYIATVLSLL